MTRAVDDYAVRSCIDPELEEVAGQWRRLLRTFFYSASVDPVALFKRAAALKNKAVEVVLVGDEKLGRAAALISEDRSRILFRESVATRAREGDAEAAFTVFHELGHFVLHQQGAPLARMVDGNLKSRFILPDESAEHQANYFARAIMMSADEVDRYPSPYELSERCGVPLVHAQLRLAEHKKLARAPKEPLPSEADKAWTLARRSPEHDGDEYALSRGGFLAAKRQYLNAGHHYGWFCECGSVVTFIEWRSD